MNVTKDIINDLVPLYVANECSADTRALVEEYLKQNPREAEELRRTTRNPVSGAVPTPSSLDETGAFLEARRRLRHRSWLMGFALFFSLAPFSFVYTNGRVWWLLRDAPRSALVYAMLGVMFWVIYAVARSRSRSL